MQLAFPELARASACAAAALAVAGFASAQLPARPNILVITTDDQDARSFEITTPDGHYVMHNVRELIGCEGVTFGRSFVPLSLCCPSRAALLTGQYNHNNHVLANVPPLGGYAAFDSSNTLPMWLQSAGYYTLHIGKYLNGWGELPGPGDDLSVPPGWNRWFTRMIATYGDSYFNYKMDEDGVLVSYGAAPSEYQTDVMTRKARQYLVQRPYGSRPFFMLLNYGAPHGQSAPPFLPVPAPRHAGRMDGAQVPMPPSFNELDVSDKPDAIAALPLLDQADIDDLSLRFRRRMEALLAVDDGVAAIIATLEQTGQLDDTLIVFTSDNGFQLGEHRIQGGKGYPYECSRVPLLLRGPGIPKDHSVSRLVANVDLTATILQLAGASPGLVQDGRSLLPLIADPSTPWREVLLLENPYVESFCGLRTHDPASGREHLYVEYDYDDDGTADEVELYNLLPDPCVPFGDTYLLENRATNACYSALIAQLRTRLAAARNCSGASCP